MGRHRFQGVGNCAEASLDDERNLDRVIHLLILVLRLRLSSRFL